MFGLISLLLSYLFLSNMKSLQFEVDFQFNFNAKRLCRDREILITFYPWSPVVITFFKKAKLSQQQKKSIFVNFSLLFFVRVFNSAFFSFWDYSFIFSKKNRKLKTKELKNLMKLAILEKYIFPLKKCYQHDFEHLNVSDHFLSHSEPIYHNQL